MTSRQEAEDLLFDLCRINAPVRGEAPAAVYVMTYLHRYRIPCRMFDAATIPEGGDCPCLITEIPGEEEGLPVLLSCHLDTVPIPHEQEIKLLETDGILKTDGSSVLGGDDRAGVAAALLTARYAAEHPETHTGLKILFTVQEEIGCRGTRELDLSGLGVSYCYNLDGETPPGSIITSAPKKGIYTFSITGKASHAALAPDAGRNAICCAAKMIAQLPQGRVRSCSTANIGMIEGGRQVNVVAEQASFTGELRSFSEDEYAAVQQELNDICRNTAQEQECGIEIAWEVLYHGYQLSEDSEVVRRFCESCRRMGIEPEMLTSAGGGDANNLNHAGIPTVVFGLGMHEIHTPEEYIILDEFHRSLQILKEVLFS